MLAKTLLSPQSSIRLVLSWALSFTLLVGCIHDSERNWAPQTFEELGIVAIIASGNTPTVRRLAAPKDYKTGMETGALSGMLLYASLSTEEQEDTPAESESSCKTSDGIGSYLGCVVVGAVVGAVLSLGAMAVSAGLGALWGTGATATGHEHQPPATAAVQTALYDVAGFPDAQIDMANHLKNAVTAALTVRPTVYTDKEYATAYGPDQRGEMHSVATFIFSELELIELKALSNQADTDPRLVLRLLVKTFRGGDKKPADTHYYEWTGDPHPLADWGGSQSGVLGAELYKGYEALSAQVIGRLGERIAPLTASPSPSS